MKTEANDLMFSTEKIAEMTTWAYYQGFSGERCSRCGATANVLARNPGWFCPCGHYNVQSWSNYMMPHKTPTYGPSSKVIKEGHEAANGFFIGRAYQAISEK